jgi:hypothetical protein
MSMSISISIASPSAETIAASQSSQLAAWYIAVDSGEDVDTLLELLLEGWDGKAQKEWREG